MIVVGGGPAGCSAAASSAREGAKTLLIEQTQALGGSSTTAMVPIWAPLTDKKEIIYRGLAEKIINGSRVGIDHVQPLHFGWTPINFEHVKRVFDDLVTGYGAEVRFQTFLAKVDKDDDGVVTGIWVANKSGLHRLVADVYVDCTGDGDLSAWAGASFLKGDEDGSLQPATHCFIFSNVNEAALKELIAEKGNRAVPLVAKEIAASGRYPELEDGHCIQVKIGPGTFGFNAGHIFGVDNTDPDCISKAAMRGRRIAESFRRGLAEYLPAVYGEAFLVTTGTQVGVRETRRIVGDYLLTLDDWLHRRTFHDEIGRNAYFIDIHVSREEARSRGEVFVEKRFPHYEPGESHGIPYRCLTPKDLRNVLVAGRCVSADRPVQGSIRVMPVCLVMGEAAGMAAAHAVKSHDSNVHAIDTDRLRERLREEGAYLP